MKNSDCLPCPCCGGYARINHGKQYEMMLQDWHDADEILFQPCSVNCSVCGLSITKAACNADHKGASGAFKEAERLAVSAWNNRINKRVEPAEEQDCKTYKDARELVDYDPNCILCRRGAGKADAGLSEDDLCHDHLATALREAQAEVSRIQNFFDAEVQLRREWQVRAEKAEAEVSRLRGIMEYLHHGESGPIPEGFLDDDRDCYEHAIDLAGGEEPTDDQWYQGWIEMIENAMVRSALKLREGE